MSQGRSLLTRSDSYKYTHHKQYPPGLTHVYSYFESRSKNTEICFFGLQHLINTHLSGQVVTQEKIDYANQRVDLHLGKGIFNRDGWQHILDKHEGRLPIVIRAVPEGMVVPSGNVLMTIENTDPAVPWLTNFLETLLMQVWYPTSVATLSRNFKKMLKKWGNMTKAPPTWLPYALHDFGFRGVSSVESAGIGGCAHLVNFFGTDTFEALEDAWDSYDCEMAGHSIPAAEHSTIISWGREHEVDAYRNMLQRFPTGLVAVVSDSYDISQACHLWGTVLKDEVMGRQGTLVVRPDSGKPHEVVLEVLDILWKHFGGTFNKKDYRVLDAHVRVIQGDGVDIISADKVLETMAESNYAAENVVFGMGGALLQKLHRDIFEFAFKPSWVMIDGVGHPVFKQPKHMASKASKAGRLKLVALRHLNSQGVIYTVGEAEYPADPDILQTVFQNGYLQQTHNFEEIRRLAAV